MAFDASTFYQAAFKKLFGLAHTEVKTFPLGNEANASQITITGKDIYTYTIPATAIAVTNQIVACTNSVDGQTDSYLSVAQNTTIAPDGAGEGHAYLVTVPASHGLIGKKNPLTGNAYTQGALVMSIIPKKFGDSWRPVLYDASKVEIPPLSSLDWILDERGFIVIRDNSSVPTYLGCYVYIGATVDDHTSTPHTYFNASGEVYISGEVSIKAGTNVTLSQASHIITINSSGGSGSGETNHANLTNLSYALANHTGFAQEVHVHNAYAGHMLSGEIHVTTADKNKWNGHTASGEIHFTEAAINHTNILNHGTNTHAQVDSHIADTTIHTTPAEENKWNGHIASGEIHFTEASIHHGDILNIGTNTHAQVDTHIADSTIHTTTADKNKWNGHTASGETHFTVASINHTSIQNIGTNTHVQLDSHVADSTIHTTTANTNKWNGHIASGEIHVTTADKSKWNSSSAGTVFNVSGEVFISGEVSLKAGTNVTLSQASHIITINASGVGGASALDDLSDVAITGVSGERGDILIRGASGWVNYPHAATSGEWLRSGGHGADASWQYVNNLAVSETSSATCWVGVFEANTGNIAIKVDTALLYNASTGALSSTLFAADTITANTAFVPDANAGAALGTIALQFSNLFLAEGGVINWDNGDLTLTQAGDVLTLGGATTLALGTSSITMSGSIGVTGTRVTKGWFTDLECTNAIAGSVTGNCGGSSATCVGNAGSATALVAQASETVVANATSGSAAPAALALAEQTVLGRITGGHIVGLTATQVRTLINVEDAADVTDATNVAAAGAVMEDDYNAYTVLAADSDNTPAALTVGASTVVGRRAADGIVAISYANLKTDLSLNNVENTAISTYYNQPLNSALTADTVSGITTTLTTGENVVLGDVCYIKSDGKAWIVDADAEASCRGVVMAAATISADAIGLFLLHGFAHCHTLAPGWTIGVKIFATITGTSTHTMSVTAPTGVNDVIQVLGICFPANDIIYFNPQLVLVVHT